MKTQISTFTYKGQDMEVLYHNGKISYVFEIGSHRYGNAVKVDGRTHLAFIQACYALLTNFIETYDAAKEGIAK